MQNYQEICRPQQVFILGKYLTLTHGILLCVIHLNKLSKNAEAVCEKLTTLQPRSDYEILRNCKKPNKPRATSQILSMLKFMTRQLDEDKISMTRLKEIPGQSFLSLKTKQNKTNKHCGSDQICTFTSETTSLMKQCHWDRQE